MKDRMALGVTLGMLLLVTAAVVAGPRAPEETPPLGATPGPRAGKAQADDPGTDGRWRKIRRDGGARAGRDEELLDQLAAIGYASGSVVCPEQVGVTVHDRERAWQGLNLVVSGHAPEALLMDMQGAVLHRWSYAFDTLWPEHPEERRWPGAQHWRRVYLYGNGDLLAIHEGIGIIKLDAASQLLWATHCGAHHDLEVLDSGDILVLTRTAHVLEQINPEAPVLEDSISVLDARGKEKRRISLVDCFNRSDAFRQIAFGKDARVKGDIFHTNTLHLLDGSIAARVPAFQAGRILSSMLYLDTVAVIDLQEQRVVWARQGPFTAQHDPQILANGKLLLLDNRDGPGRSALEEYDPLTMEETWAFRGTPQQPFFTFLCGAVQQLPNSNLLVTESDNGRAFEITRRQDTVWEYYNTHRAGDDGEYIATLFDVHRYPPDTGAGWLPGKGATP